VLEQWTTLARKNKPRFVKESSSPEWLVCTDASRWGWGYVALDQTTGETRSFGSPWSPYMQRTHGDKLGRSTFAEPHAIYNSLCHLLSKDEPKHVRIGTDNTVAQASYTRGFNSHSHDINECLRRLAKYFGNAFSFEFLHIPGASNLADDLSRGKELTHEVDGASLANSLRRLLGVE
jgi:hypothetical protein